MLVVRGHKDTDCEGTEDVEEQNTPEDSADCLWNVLTRVLCFTGGNSDEFDTTV